MTHKTLKTDRQTKLRILYESKERSLPDQFDYDQAMKIAQHLVNMSEPLSEQDKNKVFQYIRKNLYSKK